MRIINATPYFEPARGFGGPVRAMFELVAAVHAGGHETVVVSTDADGQRDRCVPTPGWEIRRGVKIYYASCWGFSKPSAIGRYFFSPGLAVQLFKSLSTADLLHLHGSWVFSTVAGARVAMFLNKPYVLSVHGSLFPWALAYKSAKKRLYLKLVEEATIRNATRVHFTTETERHLAEKIFPSLPGVVIPNPVSPCPLDVSGGTFREKLGVGRTTPLVVFLGRLHPVKGLDLLIDAATAVIREVPGTIFALVGGDEGGCAEKIRGMIMKKNLGSSVLLPGEFNGNDKWASLVAADVFVLPSHQENFGMSAAEAMACGVPVVTSPAVGIADDISTSGAGLVVERTPGGFSNAIIALLRDPLSRRRMGESGRILVTRKYFPAVVAQSMIRLYEQVLEDHMLRRRIRK